MAGTPASSRSTGSTSFVLQELKTAPGGGSASFDFQNIPQTGYDLMFTFLGQGAQAAANVSLLMTFNNDTGGNYDSERLDSSHATVAGGGLVAQTSLLVAEIAAASVASRPGYCEVVIPGYTTTTYFKAATTHGGFDLGAAQANQNVRIMGGVWLSTAAITRVTFTCSAGNIAAGSVGAMWIRGA